MEIKIGSEISSVINALSCDFEDNGFSQAINSIYFNKNNFVAVSPKLERRLSENHELAEEIARKIESLPADKNSIVIVDRSGEISQYRPQKRDRRAEQREIEDAKELAKARLRKKARLDAYFKRLDFSALRRMLIERENSRRTVGKKFRTNVSKLDSIAKSLIMR